MPSATWPTIDCEEQWRVTSGEWRENEKTVASGEKTKSGGGRERRAGSKRPNLRPLHLTIRRRMVILSERSEVEGSLFAPRHVRRWEFIHIGRRGRWWR